MKLKGRMGASLVLLLALAATIGLFHYASQLRTASVRSLQDKLQALELQRLEEDKGTQVLAAAQKAADRFNQALDRMQKRAESLADAAPLRLAHGKASARKNKEREFLKLVRQDPGWTQALLADENGSPLAATRDAQTLSATPEFREASRQRMTVLRLIERKGQDLLVQITVPCLSGTGEFLGVIQVGSPLTTAALEAIWTQPGLASLLGTTSGRRLTAVPLPGFPNHLSALMNKAPQEMETDLAQGGALYFRAEWKGKRYLVGSAEVRLPGTRVYTLLEVGGLEKLVVASAETATVPFWKDPVLIAGLVLVLLLGMGLMMWLAGPGGSASASPSPVHQLLEDLNARMEAEAPDPLRAEEYGGEVRELADVMNRWSERLSNRPAGASDDDQRRRAEQEAADLRQQRERLISEKRSLEEQVAALAHHNRQLQEAARSAPAPIEPQDAGSQLRIDAIVNMSDDLKATLTVIRNYISAILSSEEGKITDTQQEFLGVVINKSARLERQINDLLDLSHLETETKQMYMVPTDLTAMLQDVILNSQPQADTKQVRILPFIPATLSQIPTNSDRLGQVLVTLVQHALRVTPVGGEVRLEVEEGPASVIIRLRDGGAPLSPDQAANLFTRFHSADSPSGPMLAGTGLRFAILSQIVAAHHGTLVMRGLTDQGNEMRLELPKDAQTQVVTDTPAAASPATPLDSMVELSAAAGAAGGQAENAFDLSTFMQGPSDAGAEPRGGEDLDELLKNIENINDQMER